MLCITQLSIYLLKVMWPDDQMVRSFLSQAAMNIYVEALYEHKFLFL